MSGNADNQLSEFSIEVSYDDEYVTQDFTVAMLNSGDPVFPYGNLTARYSN